MIDLNEMASQNGSQRRRKPEATANKDEDRAPNRREGGLRRVLKEDPHGGGIFGRRYLIRKRNGRAGMFAVPLFSQKAMFKDWISEFDFWFRN